jgi:hypothetical protein
VAKLQSAYSVLKSINLARLMQHHVILRNDEIILIHECFFSWQQTSKKISWGLPYLHTRPNYTGTTTTT